MGMTLRVYRVTEDDVAELVPTHDAGHAAPAVSSIWPPCQCPQHRDALAALEHRVAKRC